MSWSLQRSTTASCRMTDVGYGAGLALGGAVIRRTFIKVLSHCNVAGKLGCLLVHKGSSFS